MNESIEVSWSANGSDLHVRTPGRYAMDTAVDILVFLDGQPGVAVTNTGWKQGFGLEVGAWIPIRTPSAVAELQTDGDEMIIRQASGTQGEFEAILDVVRGFLQ